MSAGRLMLSWERTAGWSEGIAENSNLQDTILSQSALSNVYKDLAW